MISFQKFNQFAESIGKFLLSNQKTLALLVYGNFIYIFGSDNANAFNSAVESAPFQERNCVSHLINVASKSVLSKSPIFRYRVQLRRRGINKGFLFNERAAKFSYSLLFLATSGAPIGATHSENESDNAKDAERRPCDDNNIDRHTSLIYRLIVGLILGLPFAVANFLLGGVLYRQGRRHERRFLKNIIRNRRQHPSTGVGPAWF